MKAMVLAAGLGTRLRPLTYEMPKPMVPVVNRPIMEHILGLLRRHGFSEVIANLHWFPDTIRDQFGDGSASAIDLDYSFEDELLGTAGGVRNVREFFGDEPFLVMAADALTDIDLRRARARRTRRTTASRRSPSSGCRTRASTGSWSPAPTGAIQGFQEKPDPAEALSDLASCMIYMLEPEIFDYFPDKPEVDFALDVFPALLENDVPFHVHEIDAYWNDVGSLAGVPARATSTPSGRARSTSRPRRRCSSRSGGEAAIEAGEPGVDGRVLVGEGCELDAGVAARRAARDRRRLPRSAPAPA